MHSSLLLLEIVSCILPALADRGSAPVVTPSICNSAPTDTSTPSPTAGPICAHAADPDGSMGLCPNLADSGWCDCGTAGDYQILTGSDVCGYTSLDPSSQISLTTTNCISSSTTQTLTETVSPIPASSASKRSEPTFIPVRRGVSRRAKPLGKRGGQISYAESCNSAPPSGSSYKAFSTMADALKQAYADAQALASFAQNVASDNKGFTHYFGGTLADIQLQHFQKMMQGIASSDNNYNIEFECSNTPDCKGMSVFVTDATPGDAGQQKVIQVCPEFWSAASTRFLLYDSNHAENNSPWRNNDGSGWCGKKRVNNDPNVSAQKNQFFATAGHSVIHELTHLDSLGSYVGLDPDENNAHGTVDIQQDCELDGARGFLSDYNAGKTSGTSPDYNAESYAAAATEIWFMNLCGFSQIQPVT